MRITRRSFVKATGAAAIAPGLAGVRQARAQAAPTLTIIDVAGNTNSTKTIFENYQKTGKARFNFLKATAPELPAKIKAQQDAGKVDIHMVLTGNDALSAGLQQGLWEPVVSRAGDKLKAGQADYLPGAKEMQKLAEGQGVVTVFTYGGPLFLYNPDQVKTPPKSLDELKAWIKANPKRFMYARPANSGPGRTLLMGLPYMLGDKDPRDPVKGWDKTWAWLEEINAAVEYYPGGTTATMKEFADGTRQIIAATEEWDMNPRSQGVIPPDSKVFWMPNVTIVTDSHFWCIPKGVGQAERDALVDLMAFALTPEQQSTTYQGFFGPASAKASLDKAPPDIRAKVQEVWRPEYAELNRSRPSVLPLAPATMVKAFEIWDQRIGAKAATKK
jgi:putative spermidine/putrescine transport system substrate-binding protein